ncbi:MAG: 4-coumarate--CoA ligase family protein [Gemmatimonadetes bacterium]|nr:4-coumarate--CoA ligase family protein [Gemmatimonadota bacterium]
MIYRSPYPDVGIPNVSVTEHVFGNIAGRENAIALIDAATGAKVTFGELKSRVLRAAGGLTARGFAKGDVVAIYSPNTLGYPVAFHGATHAGGIVTTVNPTYTTEELASQLRDSRARFLVTIGPLLEKAQEAARRAGGVQEIFTFDAAPGTTPFARLLESPELVRGPHIDHARDLVALPYSSGTTGISKGVMLTHRNLVANMVQIAGCDPLCRPLTERDTVMAVLPFFHIYGLVVVLNYALWRGASLVVVPRFELEPFLKAMQDHRVTYAYLVPPVLVALAKHPVVGQYDLSHLAGIMSGAAPLGRELANAVEGRLGCVITQGYGLTETSPVTHMGLSQRKGQCPHDSIGPSLPNTEILIADVETGQPLGPNQRGEVWVRGPQVMMGYLGQPAATAATIDRDGWLHTGDIGTVDEGGLCRIVDRVKELIKYKGYQVAPAELEAVLLTNPHIKDAAVIRSPDEEAGEVPKAYVVSDGSLSPNDVLAFVAERVSPHKKIRRVEFIDAIPKSPSGKILRRVLIEREAQRVEGHDR